MPSIFCFPPSRSRSRGSWSGFAYSTRAPVTPNWLATYKLWTKVFALSFALGVVSGIVMSFQFGTNWPGYMNKVGNIAGPLLAYEVLTAFFLEATFLGVMLFGMNRVPPWAHILATVLVSDLGRARRHAGEPRHAAGE